MLMPATTILFRCHDDDAAIFFSAAAATAAYAFDTTNAAATPLFFAATLTRYFARFSSCRFSFSNIIR